MQHLETCLLIAEAQSFMSSYDAINLLFPLDLQNEIELAIKILVIHC